MKTTTAPDRPILVSEYLDGQWSEEFPATIREVLRDNGGIPEIADAMLTLAMIDRRRANHTLDVDTYDGRWRYRLAPLCEYPGGCENLVTDDDNLCDDHGAR